jgi:hypothetical protein
VISNLTEGTTITTVHRLLLEPRSADSRGSAPPPQPGRREGHRDSGAQREQLQHVVLGVDDYVVVVDPRQQLGRLFVAVDAVPGGGCTEQIGRVLGSDLQCHASNTQQ